MTVVLPTAAAQAQQLPPFPRGAATTLEFSFSNPGARSLAFGGAFLALADDATAAIANPAGLIQLRRPEVSIEWRQWSLSTPYTAGGRASGEPTGLGLDTDSGIRVAEASTDLSGIAFASFVYPGKRWAVALYQHQAANFEAAAEIHGLFAEQSNGTTMRAADQRTVSNIDLVSYGLSGAYRITDRLSFGIGAAYYEGSSSSGAQAFALERPNALFEPNAFQPQQVTFTATLDQDGTDWTFNAGFVWRATDRWVLGGAFREGPEVDYEVEARTGPALEVLLIPAGTLVTEISGPAIAAFPDTYGLGTAFQPNDAVRVSFEWKRVEYASLVESAAAGPLNVEGLTVDDGDEFRLGFEYTFIRSKPIVALRLGGWLDPDHQIRSTSTDDTIERAIFPGGSDELHVAGGVGVKFRKFQIDLGVDLSDLIDTASVSALYQF